MNLAVLGQTGNPPPDARAPCAPGVGAGMSPLHTENDRRNETAGRPV